MFRAALFIIPPNCKESKCLSTMTGYANCGTSVSWNTIWEYERIHTSEGKRFHTVSFHLCDFLETAKLILIPPHGFHYVFIICI